MSCTHDWRIEYVPVDECQKCRARNEELEAFRRGAEAMRDHIAEVAGRNAALEWVVELVRAIPIPEEP